MTTESFKDAVFPTDTSVIVVGAGPTGLALAISLQQSGVDHVVIDKLPQGLNTSRAGVIHAHTLEMLEHLGVARDLTASGLHVTQFCVRDRDRALVHLHFDSLPSPYPYLLMLPQDQTEKILAERLAALGGGIYRGVTATVVEQDAGAATVRLAGPTGQSAVKARYVVGADGMHSIVRAATGTEFEGGAFTDSFVLADVRMDWPVGTLEVSFFFSPAGMVVVAPLPGNRFRIVATVEDAPEQPSLEFVQALIDARGPRTPAAVTEILWSSRFRLQHRVAKSYRNRRLILMGDAAHVHSPAGGQGMNTGIVDAIVLGRLLARAIHDGDDSVLDQYEQLRRPAAVEVLALSGRLTNIATMRGGLRQALRNAVLSFVNAVPATRRKLTMGLSGLSRKRYAELADENRVEPTYKPQEHSAQGDRA